MCDKMRKDECAEHPFIAVINPQHGRDHRFGEPRCVTVRKSSIHGVGVFARWTLPENVRFGPYHGIPVEQKVYKKKPESGYAWEVQERAQKPFYVDAESRASSNWMRVSLWLDCC